MGSEMCIRDSSYSGSGLRNDQNSEIALRDANNFLTAHYDSGKCKLKYKVLRLHQHRFGSGGMPFCVRRVSQATIILEKTFFLKR